MLVLQIIVERDKNYIFLYFIISNIKVSSSFFGQLSPTIPYCHKKLAVISQLLLQSTDFMQFPVVLQLLQAPELVKMDRMCLSILINKQV